MKYAALASGSKGNCHALEQGGEVLLVDAGLSLLQIRKRLEAMAFPVDRVVGVALSHEHSDHIAALPVLLRRTAWPLLATSATREALERILGIEWPAERWVPLQAGQPLAWQGWRVLPFTVPHDAVDPVAFRVEAGGRAAAVVTDLGHPTALVLDHCLDLDLLVLESNHDIDMLRSGDYPPHLKARILSRIGHLSNASAAESLARVASSRLSQVVLAHLSEANNDPELARFAALEALRGHGARLAVASQREPLAVPVAG